MLGSTLECPDRARHHARRAIGADDDLGADLLTGAAGIASPHAADRLTLVAQHVIDIDAFDDAGPSPAGRLE